jgi:hypothetical protein
MRPLPVALSLILAAASLAQAKVVVFWQDGFPVVASQPVPRAALEKTLAGMEPVFADLNALRDPATLAGADLLVLPYGSAAPVDAWPAMRAYLGGGGNLLALGGQPLRTPVTASGGQFIAARPQDVYSREIGVRHTYEAPGPAGLRFAWRPGYSFLRAPEIRARRFFVLQGKLNGLGYMVNAEGLETAAPVVVADSSETGPPADALLGSRIVMLGFEPEPGYWESEDGALLVRQAAEYARQGATAFSLELVYSTIRPGETPQVVAHLRSLRRERLSQPLTGEVKIELVDGERVIDSTRVPAAGAKLDADVFFRKTLAPGFYKVRGVWEDGGQPREFCQNGFWVEDGSSLAAGPALGVSGDVLTRGGKPFLPAGVNYFTTGSDGWDFSGPRNAWTWEKDFDEMARYGVNFVRTGVWMSTLKFVEPSTGVVNERFLRNLEAFVLSARRRNITVNFTFFSFAPRTALQPYGDPPDRVPNPYTDFAVIRAEQDYIASVVSRFKNVPWICWDLINEPTFSNPRRLWRGNTPNGDASEAAAWHEWLRGMYLNPAELAAAWGVTPEQLGSFDSIPLPGDSELVPSRYGVASQVRAIDYNHFAQDSFSDWVRAMIRAIRGAGGQQPVNVGHDEGGVTNRVLNQFYGGAGVAFTTNHTYWRDDALLWDSVAAKRPGVPNIVGETGFQPVWSADGVWRYDELTGQNLIERKWALGFAAGSLGALHWEWSRDADFGMKRTDGSAKTWQTMMRGMGRFVERTAPWAIAIAPPRTAIVLPQSYQLSNYNQFALEAQQKAVRALFHNARAEAYVVGEYQIELLGDPKLIVLPSPLGLTRRAWKAIRGKVEAGATLLVTGPFDGDAHLHPTGREKEADLAYALVPLLVREHTLRWPGGSGRLVFGGDKTTFATAAALPGGDTWAERTLGKGKVLFSPLPLELNDNLETLGAVYRYALKTAGVAPAYDAGGLDPGVLVCPTRFPHATLYVLTSESDQRAVSFKDLRSGKQIAGALDPGRAAMLLVGEDGALLAAYNWR